MYSLTGALIHFLLTSSPVCVCVCISQNNHSPHTSLLHTRLIRSSRNSFILNHRNCSLANSLFVPSPAASQPARIFMHYIRPSNQQKNGGKFLMQSFGELQFEGPAVSNKSHKDLSRALT